MTKGNPSLAIVKPDFGAAGGFERHLTELIDHLGPRGWEITIVPVDATRRPAYLAGLPVTTEMLHHHDDFFLLMGLIDRVAALDLSGFDVVLSTQPPTYLVEHPRKVALFYHQARQFYDLADRFAAAGFVSPALHTEAVKTIRGVEADAVHDVQHWLAGSHHVARRLDEFWSIPEERISVYAAPPDSMPESAPPRDADGPALTVSRHEWPKRVELAVAAIHLAESPTTLTVVGDGSRRIVSESIDARCGADPALADRLTETDLWQNAGAATRGWQPSGAGPSGRVSWVAQASDDERDARYAGASMVICPSFEEDYGLTALEAMAWQRPVIVCSDGGGLTEFVEHGVNGLIADPTPRSIAAAIDRLQGDPDYAERLGVAGRATVAEITWDRAASLVDRTLREALDRSQPA